MMNKEGEEEDNNNNNGNTTYTANQSLKKVRLLLVPNNVGHIAQKKGCSNGGVLVVLEPTFEALLHAARHKVHHKFAAVQKSSKKNHKQNQKKQKQKQIPRFFFKDGRELLPSFGDSMASVLKDDTVIVVSLTGEGFAAYPGGGIDLEEEEEQGRDAIVSHLIASHTLDNMPLSDYYATEESLGISLDYYDQEDNDVITQPPSMLEENGDSPSSSSSSSVGCCEGKKGIITEPGREGEKLSTHSSLQPQLVRTHRFFPFHTMILFYMYPLQLFVIKTCWLQ